MPDEKEVEEETTDLDNKQSNVDFNERNISNKINLYHTLLREILKKCNMKKEGLDLYYERLHLMNYYFQTSVIFLSAVSTFIQALSGGDDTNEFVPIATLCISSYSGLILAMAKYLKIEEIKENVHNLRDRFAELHSRIRYYIDLTKPWYATAHYEHFKTEDKKAEWISLIDRIETEYINIIDTKKELFSSYEKIIDTVISRKYEELYLQQNEKHNKMLKEYSYADNENLGIFKASSKSIPPQTDNSEDSQTESNYT
jgi:hypothetical protein